MTENDKPQRIPPFIQFELINPSDGKTDGIGYFSLATLISWTRMVAPDNGPRFARGKTVTCLTLATGMSWWTEESYESVSQRILTLNQQAYETAEEFSVRIKQTAKVVQ